jgi:aminoglycoside phosphotransferase (APT) family kinase protein
MTVEADPDAAVTDGRPPPAEHTIDEALVRRLLVRQHPDLADLPLSYVTDGWDNVTYRLGDELAVRLPRRAVAAELLVSEQRWLPELARRTRLAVPEPIRSGIPGEGYPWPWSVVAWVPGTPVDQAPLDPSEAHAFGVFLADLHGPAPADAPRNAHRGVALRAKADGLELRWDRLDRLDVGLAVTIDDVRAAWAEVVDVPIDVPPSWLHGDLHPKNLVGNDGCLVGVLDWGDCGVGDPANDLAAAWMLFPTAAHGELCDAYGGLTPATLARARGWAIFFGTVLLDTDVDGEDTFGRIGRTTLEWVIGGGEVDR